MTLPWQEIVVLFVVAWAAVHLVCRFRRALKTPAGACGAACSNPACGGSRPPLVTIEELGDRRDRSGTDHGVD